MHVIINDKTCKASIGQTLSKAARLNHSHVGYLCGGHGVCQTCYVTVEKGEECLSPVDDVEKAFLSPRQLAMGGRMACRARIVRDGTIKALSRPEEVRRMLGGNPLPLFSYGAAMGSDFAHRIVPGIGNIAGRIIKGEIINEDELGDLKDSVDGLVGLALETLPEHLPFKDQLMEAVHRLPAELSPPRLPVDIPLRLTAGLPLPLWSENPRKKAKQAVEIKYTSPKTGNPDQ
ncbi:2Fe-2S iron-sulfur cluster-binding protein [Prosthecochloris sp. GSB1]|uniref:2Fe-2S iron-sulfur cluster-binding protein n=1 Tax=Prosthecochloris sp. GSB1 TaxID=281093 RepID=UPI0012371A15|nr:2Fe-2S iron-sulfur cluster-binding protein [Prosthecochloris sp. GSB1]